MKTNLKKWATFTVRWGIAVFGIWYVLAKTSFHDRVIVLGDNNKPISVRVVDGTRDSDPVFKQYGGLALIQHDQVWTPAERSSVEIAAPNGVVEKVRLLAVHPKPRQQPDQPPAELLIQAPKTARYERIKPAEVAGGFKVHVPYPLVDRGLIRLVREANPLYLLIALMLLPISYFITSRRWHMLLETVDIPMGQGRAFVLNMVGSFYNSFMPGSTGGDLVKAYYASRHTTHRTRAVMSVLIDRVLGLLALIILGGVMATLQWKNPTCRHVAIASGALLVLTAIGLFVFYHRHLRRVTGLDWMLKRLPMQHTVHRVVETMEIYGRRPGVSLAAVAMTFPVHMTTIISAMFAGKAFGLPLHAMYYWVVVPVITLAGAIPISPQGAGVMEPLAVELTRMQGVTVSQAFALVMAIRFCQIFWNVAAALFVLRGGYHAPTQKEAEELEVDDEEGQGSHVQGSGASTNPVRSGRTEGSPVVQGISDFGIRIAD
jgi:glycosyltransferase 2 family protein